MKSTNHLSPHTRPRLREPLALAALGLLALALAWILTASSPAIAGPLQQDSPLATPQEQLSPLPTAEPEPAQPTPATSPTTEAPATVQTAAKPPLPLGVLVGIMAVIGLAALIIGLRRK